MSQDKVTVDKVTVGDVVAAFLESCGVDLAFGVISIHNMPMLDAIHRRGKISFIPARGEAGATGMADAGARVSGKLGVVFTSTGTAAGNAAGAIVEAATAGTPLLHLTSQIDAAYVDRNFGYIHEARDQLSMLKAISKAAFRILTPEETLPVLREAVRAALTAPSGPVSIEIPVDVQLAPIAMPNDLAPLPVKKLVPDAASLDRFAARLAKARRPLLWLGGGARDAVAAVRRLAAMGIGVVTSTSGRGLLPEDHPLSLGCYGGTPPVEALYGGVDLMLILGSHLRSNETKTYTLKLPQARLRVDADPAAEERGYASEEFLLGDAGLVLEGLADRLDGKALAIDPGFAADVVAARKAATEAMRKSTGPYVAMIDVLERQMPKDALWVRDITLSNSIWGNRAPRLPAPRQAVHAMGGGIGQGVPMAVGAALAAPGRKVIALTGDGGLAMCLGELATAAQSRAGIVFLLMSDGGYGVIRNIQDHDYQGRHCYTELQAPHFGLLAESLGIPHRKIGDLAEFSDAFGTALETGGPTIIEFDMASIGSFVIKFGGFPAPPAAAVKP